MSAAISLIHSLIDVAMGRAPADLVILGGRWVCVQSGEIVPDTDVAIRSGRIAYVGPDASHTIRKKTRVLKAGNRYLVPGLLDGHMHIESGMLTVTEFVRAVLPHGTTCMFVDPHEIANVFGLRGVKMMVDEAAKQPIHVWVQMPSCVPSSPGLETPGSSVGPREVEEAMTWPGIIGLGEVMNFPDVHKGDSKILSEIAATRLAGKVVGGHYAADDLGLPFHGYVAGGAQDDHEGYRLEDAIARARQGMKVMLRYGSAWHDVAAQLVAVTQNGLDPHHFILCTDDTHAETLLSEGHMDRVVRHAIAEGLNPLTAIQMATLNTAEHFGLSHAVGMIAPGRWADILLVKDLNDLRADLVIARGRLVARRERLLVNRPHVSYPVWATRSVRLKRPLVAGDFSLHVPHQFAGANKVNVNVIRVVENKAHTRRVHLDLPVRAGEICLPAPVRSRSKSSTGRDMDIAKVAVVERHKASGAVRVALVQGFGLTESCAIASTVAHDCHHMLVVGNDETSMAVAGNKLAQIGGGQVVVRGGKVIGLVRLNIAGLMSTRRVGQVARQVATLLEGFRKCGCRLNNPNMTLSLLALVVIPELRISDKGLVDVTRFKLIPVVQGKAVKEGK